jgi:hypothetical protein
MLALDVRCQHRHELQRYSPLGAARPRGKCFRAMAGIATKAFERLAQGTFEYSDMPIDLDLSHSAGSHPAWCPVRGSRLIAICHEGTCRLHLTRTMSDEARSCRKSLIAPAVSGRVIAPHS